MTHNQPTMAPSAADSNERFRMLDRLVGELINKVLAELKWATGDDSLFQFGSTPERIYERNIEILKVLEEPSTLTFKLRHNKHGGPAIGVYSGETRIGILTWAKGNTLAPEENMLVESFHMYGVKARNKPLHGVAFVGFQHLLKQAMLYKTEEEIEEVIPLVEKAILEIS